VGLGLGTVVFTTALSCRTGRGRTLDKAFSTPVITAHMGTIPVTSPAPGPVEGNIRVLFSSSSSPPICDTTFGPSCGAIPVWVSRVRSARRGIRCLFFLFCLC
ncbi:hypothetical protein FPV67DRAFT_1464357, partial [Lyophyllum atratum]